MYYVVFLLWLIEMWTFTSLGRTPGIVQLTFFVFLFPASWFHSTLSQVSIQLKILSGLSIDLQGSLFVHLPFFWYFDPLTLFALASLKSDLYLLISKRLMYSVWVSPFLHYVWKEPPGSNWGSHREGSYCVFPFFQRLQSCFAFCLKSENSGCIYFICSLVVYIKAAIPIAVNNS